MSKQSPYSLTPDFSNTLPHPSDVIDFEADINHSPKLNYWQKLLRFWNKLIALEKITFFSFFIDAVAMGGISYLGVQAAFQASGFFSFFGIMLAGGLFSNILIIAAVTGGLCFLITRLLDFYKKINDKDKTKLLSQNENAQTTIASTKNAVHNPRSPWERLKVFFNHFDNLFFGFSNIICTLSTGASAFIGTYALFAPLTAISIALGAAILASVLRMLTFVSYNYGKEQTQAIKHSFNIVFGKEPLSEKQLENGPLAEEANTLISPTPSSASTPSLDSQEETETSSPSPQISSGRGKKFFKFMIFFLSGTCKGFGAFFAASIFFSTIFHLGLMYSVIISVIFGLNCIYNTVRTRIKKDEQYNQNSTITKDNYSSTSRSQPASTTQPWYQRNLLHKGLYLLLITGIVFDMLGSAVSYPGANIKTIEDCLNIFAHHFVLGGLSNPLTIALLSFAIVISLASLYSSWLFTYGPSKKDFDTFCAPADQPMPINYQAVPTRPEPEKAESLNDDNKTAKNRAITSSPTFFSAASVDAFENNPTTPISRKDRVAQLSSPPPAPRKIRSAATVS